MPKLRRPKFLTPRHTQRQRAGAKLPQNGRFSYPKGIHHPLTIKALRKSPSTPTKPRPRPRLREKVVTSAVRQPASRRHLRIAQNEIDRLERALAKTNRLSRAQALENRLELAQAHLDQISGKVPA
jgi:hypothetical protein